MVGSAATIVDLVRASCERWPDRPVLTIDGGPTLTRVELRGLVERAMGALDGRFAPGDRVVVSMENRVEYLVAFIAVVARRGVVVPLNPASGPVDGRHILRASRAVLAIVDEAGAKHVADREELADLRAVIELGGDEPDGLPAGPPVSLADARTEADDLVAVTFTSGTTGLPKGCMIDHRWLLRATDVALRIHEYTPDDRIFYPVKFFYMDAPLALLRAFACGGRFVATRAFSVSRFWDVVRRHEVTILSTIASMPAWLLKAPPRPDDRDHKVRFAIQAHIAPELHAAMDERWGFPWLENYGMTEAGLIARVPVELADRLRATGAAGPPAPGVEVRIVDEELADVPAGRPGEILVRQPGMFRGYLDMPEATAELLHDGWIRTGDVGTLDADGILSVVGRIKEMIRRSGENISAAEVETVLAAHPAILEAAAVAVPDADHGEEVKVYVQLVDGTAAADVEPAEIVAFCAARLARHKVPRYLQIVDDLPRTVTHRVRKQLLADLAGEVVDTAPLRGGGG